MKKTLFTLCFALCVAFSFAQQSTHVGFRSSFSILGERDDKAGGVGMQFLHKTSQKFGVGATMNYAASKDLTSNNVTNYHSRSLFMLDLDAAIFLLRQKKINVVLTLSPSIRHRNEWLPTHFKQESQKPTEITDSVNINTFDVGAKEQVALRYQLSAKLSVSLFGELRQYNSGTPLSTLGLQVGLDL